jgi:hypothetical protein
MNHNVTSIALIFIATHALSTSAQGINYQTAGANGRVLTAAQTGWLVTPAEAIEFKGEDGFNEPPALRARSPMPLIDILKPEPIPDLRVKAPFTISVQFTGQTDAGIDPASFKVLYGAFKFDITSRVTKFIKVTKDGFTLENAQIPTGKHRLTLQVQDEKQRTAERELRLEVE